MMHVPSKRLPAKGTPQWVTGDVFIDTIVSGTNPPATAWTPSAPRPARTAWHANALGQTPYVTEGAGLIQSRGGEIIGIGPGDVMHASAHEWHWHGAAPDHSLTHVSITEGVDHDSDQPDNAGRARHRGRVLHVDPPRASTASTTDNNRAMPGRHLVFGDSMTTCSCVSVDVAWADGPVPR